MTAMPDVAAPWPADDPAVEWLLASPEPAIRYRTLTEVLGRADSDADVRRERAAIPHGPKVSEIFAAQRADGGWGATRHAHKYTGTPHVVSVLRQFRFPADDPRLPRAAALVGPPARRSLAVIDGRVRWHMGADAARLATLCWLGRAGTPEAKEIVDFMVSAQWPDGGWNCDKKPTARHSSFIETVGATQALFAYHALTGDSRAWDTAVASTDIFIKRGVIRSQRTGSLISGRITQLHWPRDYDMLLALSAIAPGGLHDPRLDEVLDLVESKRRKDGHWVANGPKPKVVREGPGEVADFCDGTRDQMVTLRALTVLRAAGRAPAIYRGPAGQRPARRGARASLRRTREDLINGLLADAGLDDEVIAIDLLTKDDDGAHSRLQLRDHRTVILREYATTGGNADLFRAKEALLYKSLATAGLPTPKILASVSGSKGAGGDAAATLLTDNGGRPLEAYLTVTGKTRSGLWAAAGRTLRQLHDADLVKVWPFRRASRPGTAVAANLLKVVRRVHDAGLAPPSAVETTIELRPRLRSYFDARPRAYCFGGHLPQMLLSSSGNGWEVTEWLGWGFFASPGDPMRDVTAINRTVGEYTGEKLPDSFWRAYGQQPDRVCELVYDLQWLLHVAPLYAKDSGRVARPSHTRALEAAAELEDTLAEIAVLLD